MARFLLQIVLFLGLCQPLASAHAPHFEKMDMSPASPFVIDWRLDKSIAIYAHFDHPGDVDMVSFTLDSDDLAQTGSIALHVSTLVPACHPYRHLLPAIAVVGPAQPSLSHRPRGDLPFSLRASEGIYLVTNTEQGEVWYEPFGRKHYYVQNGANLDLYYPGVYRLYAWVPDGSPGDYVFEIGTRERFNLGDILRSLYLVPSIWLDREITNAQCNADQTPEGDIGTGTQ